MISILTPLQIPIYLLIGAIFLCLLFEGAGLPEGFRRQTNRNHLSLITATVVLVIFFLVYQENPNKRLVSGELIFDHLSRSAILSLSVLFLAVLWIIVERLKPLNNDRGEIYALSLVSFLCCILLTCANDATLVVVAQIAWPCTQIGVLAIQKKRRACPEIALKTLLFSMFLIVFLAIFLAFLDASTLALFSTSYGSVNEQIPEVYLAALVLFISLLCLLMGAAPVQAIHVDVLDGSTSYISAFYAGAVLITSSTLLIRIIPSIPDDLSEDVWSVLFILAAISLCLSPIMAFDQRRISRLVSYLLASQAGLAILGASITLHQESVPTYFYGLLFTHFAFCSAGSYAGLNFWKDSKHSFKTWEDFAGAGRKHPVAAGSFFIVLAAIGGFPFTSGFVLRNAIVEMTPPDLRLQMLTLFLISALLSIVCVARLFAFFFAKATRHELRKHHRPRQFILLVSCALILFFSSIAPEFIMWSIFG